MKYKPFMGFSLFGVHSSRFNVYRILDGGKYHDTLSPEFEHITESVAGYHGEYDFGTNIKSKVIPLKCYCENITESQYRQLRRWLSPGKVGKLIYDESPYKAYTVKMHSSASLSFQPVEIFGGNLVYTGTLDIELVANNPYAYARFDSLDEIKYDNGLFYDSGLLYRDYMPTTTFSGISGNKNIVLYNGGTERSKVNVRINGTWDSLTIKNFTTNQQFTLSKNSINTTFEVDASRGQCRLNDMLASDYHSGTYLELEGTDRVDGYESVSFTKGSNLVAFPIDAELLDDIIGKYVFLKGDRYKIVNKINDSQIKLDSAFRGNTDLYDIVIVDANDILITGANLNISKLEFLYRYTYI